MMRVRPSKPVAVLSAVVGLGILGFGLAAMSSGDEDVNPAFMVFWVLVCLGIVGFNLWAAFARGGHTYSISDDR